MLRQEISDAVSPLGWRLVLGAVCAEVLTSGLAGAVALAAAVVEETGSESQGHLTIDVRPAVWFQQMDASRPQRNRIHLDVDVPHDVASARIAAALAAGGVMVSDRAAPAFWVLADAEGNEVCVCTWQGRD
ncbi:VOC family protein [Mycolicibacterium aubagnense]|nr:VOC family protein [Mycolicibacterium aubagnense]WGI35556.1 VOC family protein [Mycolicibacterium aubagnense]